MTREEAAKILDPETSRDAFCKYVGEHSFMEACEACNEACRIAAAALCAKQTPLDRSRWEGCLICEGESYLDGDICISGTHYARLSQFNFCPDCGRPLTEEAWAELERRISGGTTDKKDQ